MSMCPSGAIVRYSSVSKKHELVEHRKNRGAGLVDRAHDRAPVVCRELAENVDDAHSRSCVKTWGEHSVQRAWETKHNKQNKCDPGAQTTRQSDPSPHRNTFRGTRT